MIPSLDHIVRALKGAWLLFLWDPKGATYFDQSIRGFWQSFFAPIAMAPIYVFALVELRVLSDQIIREAPENVPALSELPSLDAYLWVNMIAYFVSIAIFPLIMVFIVRFLRLGSRYVTFIIAYNWASPVIASLSAMVFLSFSLGLVGPAATSGLILALGWIVSPLYVFFISYTTLEAGIFTAVSLVLIDRLIGILINIGAGQFY